MRRKIWLPLVFIVVVAVGGLIGTLMSGNSPELGLDLQGGVSVVLEPTSQASGEAVDQAVQIIRDRVDALGVAEPDITRQGNAIVVQLPGVKNRDRALELVGQTAELRFRPVLQDLTGSEVIEPDESQATTTTTAEGSTTTTTTTAPDEGAAGLPLGESAAAAQEPTTTAPPATTTTTAPTTTTTAPGQTSEPVQLTSREDDKPDATVILQGKDGEGVYQLGPSLATGTIVSSAHAAIPQGQWLVELSMKGGADGIDKFNEIAAQCNPPSEVCPTGRLAIVLDSVVQSAPTIQESTYSKDDITISGSFSQGEAKDLALVLRYGALPVELERQSVQTVSASLGEDSLRAGIFAGVVGLMLVALYMLVYYRALGLVLIVGVSMSGALLYTIVSWLGETRGLALTLAGVTGIIVSIGVTVDSYVVFFERLKDEVKAGRTLRSSTERAFKRAFRTILAADISSFLGAAVLWWLTVGSVRGFAFFLGLSTILDVIVAWFFSRPAVILLSRNPFFTDMPGFGVARGLASGPTPSRPPATPAPAPGGGS
jgi:preprotein translocase subunit SecD